MSQCLDATVLKSREESLKPGTKLHLDVPLVKGNRLFERSVPQFSATAVTVGSVLAIKATCLQKHGTTGYLVDPSCITPVKAAPGDSGRK